MKQIHLDFKREVFTLCLFLLAVMNYACSGGSSSGDDNTKTDDTPSLVISQTVFNIGPTDTKVTLSVAASASYYVKSIGGWRNGALTEDTDISFKIMESGKLIALAYNSEAFQQEPETVRTYMMQRKRWAKGNYEVVISNFKNLFNRSKTVGKIKREKLLHYEAVYPSINHSSG